MKHVLLAVFFVMATVAATAQTSKDDIQILQAAFGKEKAELVKAFMNIPADQDAAFWDLYDKYEEARRVIGKDRILLIEDYANAYETLDDKKATDLMARKLKINDATLKMQKKYFDQFSKIIGGRQTAKFFQLEDYLQNIINLGVQENIPFIDELDKTKLPEVKQ